MRLRTRPPLLTYLLITIFQNTLRLSILLQLPHDDARNQISNNILKTVIPVQQKNDILVMKYKNKIIHTIHVTFLLFCSMRSSVKCAGHLDAGHALSRSPYITGQGRNESPFTISLMELLSYYTWAFIADGDCYPAHLQKVVRSLYVRIGHPDSATTAQMFVKRCSGKSQKPVLEVLKKVECDMCQRGRAIPQRPRAALHREPLFNHTVKTDASLLRQHPVLRTCCLIFRYSQGAVLQ